MLYMLRIYHVVLIDKDGCSLRVIMLPAHTGMDILAALDERPLEAIGKMLCPVSADHGLANV